MKKTHIMKAWMSYERPMVFGLQFFANTYPNVEDSKVEKSSRAAELIVQTEINLSD